MNKLIIADSFSDSNMFYATKVLIPDPFIFILINSKKYILVNSMEFERIKKEAEKNILVILQDTYFNKAKSKFKNPGLETIAYLFLKEKNISSIKVPPNFQLKYADILRKLRIKVETENPFFDRTIKTKEEIKKIKNVQKIAEKAFNQIIKIIKKAKIKGSYLYNGNKKLTSEYLRNATESVLTNNNIESPEGIIVSSGISSSFPHKLGYGPIKAGNPIIIDIFPRSQISRYFTDMTRTVSKGMPKNQKIQGMYNIVLEAQKEAYKKIKEGVTCETIHNAVISVFKKYKMEKFFIHSTGHGLGLDIHESPSIPSKIKLKAGMIITIEPGLYVPNLGGIRIEDVFLVTKNGYKTISKLPKRFVI